MIREEEKTITKKKCISVACYKYKDTGRKTIVNEKDQDGKDVVIEKPIMEKELQPAKYQEIEESITVYVIEYLGERHEFIDKKDALEFKRAIQ